MADETKKKDPNTGMILEIICAFFGLLGVGHIWAGNITIGLIALVVYLVVLIIEWVFIVPLLGAVTAGLGCCLYIFYPLQNLIVGVISSLFVKKYIEESQGGKSK